MTGSFSGARLHKSHINIFSTPISSDLKYEATFAGQAETYQTGSPHG